MIGSGTRRSPFLSGKPPSRRIVSSERWRWWCVPMRPVAPLIAMVTVRVAIAALLSRPMQRRGHPSDRSPPALEGMQHRRHGRDCLRLACGVDHHEIAGFADLETVVSEVHDLGAVARYHFEARCQILVGANLQRIGMQVR